MTILYKVVLNSAGSIQSHMESYSYVYARPRGARMTDGQMKTKEDEAAVKRECTYKQNTTP